MQKLANFFCQESRLIYCPTRTRFVLDDKIGQLFGYRSTNFLCYHGDCLQWAINIYFGFLFSLLLYNIYFNLLDSEK